VHFALPEGVEAPRPGDVATVTITRGAPHYLEADELAGFRVRRTRAGDAWEARQARPEPEETGPRPVSLGLPSLRVR
jgi:tRNA-2-methylthio-N6-dimethylallyladenosine synthase